jgi:hypothetical protein
MIIQINIFSCDICKKIIKQTMEKTSCFRDPVVEDSELQPFKKIAIIFKEEREMYSGEACLECVSQFENPESDLKYFRLDKS